MRRKYQVAVAVLLVIGLIGTGIAVFHHQQDDKLVGPYVALTLQPSQPSITHSSNGIDFSVGLAGNGPDFPVENVSVYALDDDCDIIATIQFGTVEGARGAFTADRRTATAQSVPQYLIVDVPDRYYSSRNPVRIRGFRRTSETPTNGSYNWTDYKITEPSNQSTWCNRRR